MQKGLATLTLHKKKGLQTVIEIPHLLGQMHQKGYGRKLLLARILMKRSAKT